ncbi:hypothetical protein [Streptomyces gobiensis]|uniref:hypothetical protein n=1 Tax=Streptomyces gobiensis TaxID=2875706 RepID=UPI001E2EAE1D|nr:hypothetical protein [Streptomyces gobiensis]UGY93376.1 hypothetical protein test1122_17755 [Streptomyces gobiensis]
MFKARSVVKPAIGAALLTLGVIAVTLLTLMFSTGTDEIVKRKALFGALIFETVEKDNGALSITTGVENPVPLIVLFLVLTTILMMTQAIYRGRKQRREQLLNESGS